MGFGKTIDESLSLMGTLGGVTNEESVLDEALGNLREAAQRIRATQNVMHARGMTEDVHYRELLTRFSTALAVTEFVYSQASPSLSASSPWGSLGSWANTA